MRYLKWTFVFGMSALVSLPALAQDRGPGGPGGGFPRGGRPPRDDSPSDSGSYGNDDDDDDSIGSLKDFADDKKIYDSDALKTELKDLTEEQKKASISGPADKKEQTKKVTDLTKALGQKKVYQNELKRALEKNPIGADDLKKAVENAMYDSTGKLLETKKGPLIGTYDVARTPPPESKPLLTLEATVQWSPDGKTFQISYKLKPAPGAPSKANLTDEQRQQVDDILGAEIKSQSLTDDQWSHWAPDESHFKLDGVTDASVHKEVHTGLGAVNYDLTETSEYSDTTASQLAKLKDPKRRDRSADKLAIINAKLAIAKYIKDNSSKSAEMDSCQLIVKALGSFSKIPKSMQQECSELSPAATKKEEDAKHKDDQQDNAEVQAKAKSANDALLNLYPYIWQTCQAMARSQNDQAKAATSFFTPLQPIYEQMMKDGYLSEFFGMALGKGAMQNSPEGLVDGGGTEDPIKDIKMTPKTEEGAKKLVQERSKIAKILQFAGNMLGMVRGASPMGLDDPELANDPKIHQLKLYYDTAVALLSAIDDEMAGRVKADQSKVNGIGRAGTNGAAQQGLTSVPTTGNNVVPVTPVAPINTGRPANNYRQGPSYNGH